MTKTLNQIIFFPPPKSEYFFQQHWESEYFFRKKPYPPFKCRSASGLEDTSGVTQVNSLIYSMGPEADDIVASFELNDENKKKYAKVKETFDSHFIERRLLLSN
jgi:hypothetical protein